MFFNFVSACFAQGCSLIPQGKITTSSACSLSSFQSLSLADNVRGRLSPILELLDYASPSAIVVPNDLS